MIQIIKNIPAFIPVEGFNSPHIVRDRELPDEIIYTNVKGYVPRLTDWIRKNTYPEEGAIPIIANACGAIQSKLLPVLHNLFLTDQDFHTSVMGSRGDKFSANLFMELRDRSDSAARALGYIIVCSLLAQLKDPGWKIKPYIIGFGLPTLALVIASAFTSELGWRILEWVLAFILALVGICLVGIARDGHNTYQSYSDIKDQLQH